jgi:hypothetical protein
MPMVSASVEASGKVADETDRRRQATAVDG